MHGDVRTERTRSYVLFERWLNGVAILVVEHGKPIKDRLEASHVEESEVLEAAREAHGLERMDQIKFAVLEPTGDITIVPKTA